MSLNTTLLTNTSKTALRRPYKPPDYLLPSFASSPLSSPLTSQLDPFFPLPCQVTEREKSLLQLYFTMTPGAVYATYNNAPICPIRDMTAVGVQADRMFLQWIVLAADMYLLQGKPSATSEPHILSRKAYIYKLMNRAIADPTTCYSDNTFMTMVAAAVAIARFEGSAQARKHLLALRKLMEVRGGSSILQDMPLAYSIVTTNCFLSIGTKDATFAGNSSLCTAIRDFIGTFQAMQAWNQSLRIEFEGSNTEDDADGTKYSDGKLPPVSDMLSFATIRDLQRYRSTRGEVFGPQSCLRRYISPTYAIPVESERRCHFAALWIINKMLYDLRHNYHESRDFVAQLSEAVAACEIPATDGYSTSTATPLKPLAVIYILETIAVKHSPEFAKRGGILHSWDSINPLELMELATNDSHTEVTALLSSWLTNDECNIFYMTENRLSAISQEITNEWLRQRCLPGLE